MGSNMAENHPVGFQWVLEARERGAKVIHVDPRFTRTSAMSTNYVPLRAGTDIAFLGGVIRYVLEHERYFRDYVVHYTNAPAIVSEDFRDTEDLDGFFSGYDPETHTYDHTSWQYEGMPVHPPAGEREHGAAAEEEMTGGAGAPLASGRPPELDPTLQHPRCVFQLLRRHFARYTPEFVAETCGTPVEDFLEVCEALCENSGRERTSAFVYSVGWTQHTVGVQYIRAASILQLLLGNVGRPGGGILALRGHASIQGSTDIPTLYDLLPGYLPMPNAGEHDTLAEYVEAHTSAGGYWGSFGAYAVSLLKAYWGPAATADNDFCFDHVPRISGDHDVYRAFMSMLDGSVKGLLLPGQNPAVGSANSRLHRLAMAKLDWLVVRDVVETESAAFWHDCPELETGELKTEEIPTEVFFLPAAAHVEKDGTFTNTQRLLQWHRAALDPKEDCRSELWFYYHLGTRIREKLAGSEEPRDRPILDLQWSYPTHGPHAEPSAEAVLREINGSDANGEPLSTYEQLRDDGSTACGCWIYCGCFAGGVNQTARKKPHTEMDRVAGEWAWAWPLNRRLLYNRASADPQGKPWSERKRYVWWDEEGGEWTGLDVPDFTTDKPPGYEPPEEARGVEAIRGDQPFVMQADGLGWLYVPSGLRDGPLPTHYEAHESPVDNPLHGQSANPTRQQFHRDHNPSNPSAPDDGWEAYPYVLTSYRLTEHHTAGAMSRFVPTLSELQPEMFCEVSPELAAERGLEHGGWATIVSSNSAIEARVLVTDRLQPLDVRGRRLHQVGLPYHWGNRGLTRGDAANDLFPIVLDPNVHIQEVKAASCDIRPGRRPRGKALRELVESYPKVERGAHHT
jgi:formate dehydrogenase major subunit